MPRSMISVVETGFIMVEIMVIQVLVICLSNRASTRRDSRDSWARMTYVFTAISFVWKVFDRRIAEITLCAGFVGGRF